MVGHQHRRLKFQFSLAPHYEWVEFVFFVAFPPPLLVANVETDLRIDTLLPPVVLVFDAPFL